MTITDADRERAKLLHRELFGGDLVESNGIYERHLSAHREAAVAPWRDKIQALLLYDERRDRQLFNAVAADVQAMLDAEKEGRP